MSDGPAKRRWFRFSLLTMFVLVTAFGCWLGYGVNWIRQRYQLREDPSIEFTPHTSPEVVQLRQSVLLWLIREPSYKFVTLQLSGPLPIDGLTVAEQEKLEQVQECYPEVEVGWMKSPDNRPQPTIP